MVKLTKIYTRRGDEGMTDLAGGVRVTKSHLRVAAMGDLDELNACLGLCAVAVDNDKNLCELHKTLLSVQNRVFDVGTYICVLDANRREDTPSIQSADTAVLEAAMDEMNSVLLPLNSFVLPGGGESAARLHMARVVCRRAERSMIVLNEQEPLAPIVMAYINRLSDWLFVAARFVAAAQKQAEIVWVPKR